MMADTHLNSSTSWLPYMTKTNNYNNWIFEQYKGYIGKRIVDIGSGYGTFLDYIKDRDLVFSVDPSKESYDQLKQDYASFHNIVLIHEDFNNGAVLDRLRDEKIDTFICLNVLEHIEDDELTLKNIHKCLVKGGRLILYVPALSMIYGTLDISLGHFRRYNKKELESKINALGFKIIKSRYVNFLGAFSWFLYSKVLKKSMPAEKRILFYDKYLVPVVSFIEGVISLPFGQSLMIICEK